MRKKSALLWREWLWRCRGGTQASLRFFYAERSNQNVLLGLQVASRRELFEAVDHHMAHLHGLPKGVAALSLTNRERIGSTGLGQSVAVPHARLRQLGHVCLMYVQLASPIDFGAEDGQPVKDVVVLLVPEKACQQHLDILADMTRLLSNARLRDRLHRCRSADSVCQLFANWPQPA